MATKQAKPTTHELFGNRLQELLNERKLTYEVFAEEIYIDKNTIGNYVRGKTLPKIDIAVMIAKYFDVSTDYLLGHYLEVPISEVGNLFDGSLKRKCAIKVMVSRNSPIKLQCLRYQKIDELKLYPKVEDAERPLSFMDSTVIQEDNYSIINGNIYNATSKHGGEQDISIYDYVSIGKRIKRFADAYRFERHTLGLIGTLSADEFYLLNYILGYHEKKRQS